MIEILGRRRVDAAYLGSPRLAYRGSSRSSFSPAKVMSHAKSSLWYQPMLLWKAMIQRSFCL